MKNVVQDLTSAGIDWQREKWQSGLGSKFIHQGEKNAAKYADEVIVLSKGVQDYFKETYKGAEAMLYVTANECFTRFDGCICSVQLAEGFFEIRSLEDLNRLANSSVKKMQSSGKMKKLIAMLEEYKRADLMLDISGYELCSKLGNYPTLRYLFKIALCKSS